MRPTAARDEEGAIAWSLTGADGGDFEITTDGQVTFRQTPNFEAALDADGDNVYSFNVVATDTMSGSTRRNVSAAVTVTVADLEEDGTIAVDNADPGVGNTLRFTLTDPDGGIKTGTTTADGLEWTIEGRTGGSGAWTAITTVTNNTTFVTYLVDEDDTGEQLRASLTYEDRRGTGKTAESEPTKAVTADPIANAPPRFRNVGNFSIAEGEAGRNVGSPIQVSDRDNDSLTFGIGAGGDGAFFAITSSGQLRLVQTVDFETAHLLGAARVLYATVTLHDGKGVDGDNNATTDTTVDVETTLTIQITDVEEEGTVTLSAEEPETGVELTATLEDGDGSVSGESWQWARSADGRTNWVNIAAETANTYTPTENDEDLYLRAQVEYADNRGPGKGAEGVADAPVPSANRRPAFPETEDGQRTVQENTRARINIGGPVAAADREGDRLIYTLTGADADAAAFEIIEGTGQLRTLEVLDFENPADADPDNVYEVTVNVHDGRDGAGAASTAIDDTLDVTITVQNVEEPGTITLSTLTGIIQARVEVTATLGDPDSVGDVAWQWSQSPSRAGWANIAGATSSTHTPLDDHEGQFLRVTATYTDGHGPNKTARTVSSRRVAEPPPVNSAPVFPATEDGRREVLENAAGGATVGAPVAATDLNAGDSSVNDPLVYSLSGTDAASFAIDAGTGQLSLATAVTLDYETKRSYRVTVEVTDGRDSLGDDEDPGIIDARLNVTINVTDVNEAPEVSGDTAVTVDENLNRAIATYQGTDPERDTLAWSVNNEAFWISERGQLYFRTPPSFEESPTHNVTVTATDPGGLESNALAVAVTVTDLEEEGMVTVTPLRGWEDTLFSATLADGDGDLSSESWQWRGPPTNRAGPTSPV